MLLAPTMRASTMSIGNKPRVVEARAMTMKLVQIRTVMTAEAITSVRNTAS